MTKSETRLKQGPSDRINGQLTSFPLLRRAVSARGPAASEKRVH